MAGLQVCAFSPAEPSYPGVVQPPQSAAAAGPLLHRPPALRPAEGAVSGDPHALHYQQVGTHKHTQVTNVGASIDQAVNKSSKPQEHCLRHDNRFTGALTFGNSVCDCQNRIVMI